jgi:GT2 family glycosyltransferase
VWFPQIGSSFLPPEVSIITVYYNTPEDLLRLHRSALECLDSNQYEFIVADNQSDSDLSSKLSGVSYLRLPENFGYGRASNMAAQNAAAPYLFFVNPDCEFIHDCLTPLLGAIQRSAVAGPKVLNPDRSIQLSFGPFLSILAEAQQKRRMHAEKSVSVQKWLTEKTAHAFHPDYVSGCALMIRTDVFRKAGGFDENYFLYNEDVDLCKRIHNQGLEVSYEPSAHIIHYRNQSVKRVPERAKAEYRKSQIYYYQKHHGALQNLLLKLYLSSKGY